MGAKLKAKDLKSKPEEKVATNPPNVPESTFMPMAFWSQMVQTLDIKTKTISEVYGYGRITMELVVFNGKVKDVVFNDEVRVRPEWDKPPLSNS